MTRREHNGKWGTVGTDDDESLRQRQPRTSRPRNQKKERKEKADGPLVLVFSFITASQSLLWACLQLVRFFVHGGLHKINTKDRLHEAKLFGKDTRVKDFRTMDRDGDYRH